MLISGVEMNVNMGPKSSPTVTPINSITSTSTASTSTSKTVLQVVDVRGAILNEEENFIIDNDDEEEIEDTTEIEIDAAS